MWGAPEVGVMMYDTREFRSGEVLLDWCAGGVFGLGSGGSVRYSRVRKVLIPSRVPRENGNALLTLLLDYSV